MKYRTRIYYTEAQKTLMWDRWQKGESLSSIARFFDRHHSSVEGILKQTGGIRPRRRPRRALTLSEREEISRDVVAGCSIRSIARTLGRAPSTVSREIRRNGGRLRYGVVSLALDSFGFINALGFLGTGGIMLPSCEDPTTLVNDNTSVDTFVTKYDVNGNCIWADLIGGDEDIVGNDIAADTLGNVFITGDFIGTVGFAGSDLTLTSTGEFGDGYLAKYDFGGNALWARRFGDEVWALGNRVAVDDIGNSFVAGVFDSKAVFGSESPATQTTLLTDTIVDMFVVMYDAAGGLKLAKPIAGGGIEGIDLVGQTEEVPIRTNPIQLLYSKVDGGQVYLSGDFDTQLLLDGFPLTAGENARDGFVAKLDVSAITTGVSGDVTGDGLVDVNDFIAAVNFILGLSTPTNAQSTAADVNQDGVLNVNDVIGLINIILN